MSAGIQGVQAVGPVRFSNFSNELEAALNRQINGELHAVYAYQAMASWCARDDVALHGLRALCLAQAAGELCDARGLIDYLTRKGGNVTFFDIASPSATGIAPCKGPLQLLDCMLELEKKNFLALLAIQQAAAAQREPELEHFIQQYYLKPQTREVKRIADIATNLKRCGIDGTGLFIWDRELQSSYGPAVASLPTRLPSYALRPHEDVLPRPFKP